MPQVKFKDIIKKSDQDLTKDLKEKREAVRVFRFGVAGSKIKNMKEAKNLKREIARILTAKKQLSAK